MGSFGYKTPDGNSYYYLKDHIGNIRVTVNEQGEIVTKDDYYPFGLRMPGLSYNNGNENDRLKFQSKRLQDYGNWKTYYFGWRDYDPELGRWFVVDPARQFASPYVYGGNNPVIGIEEDGRWFGIDDLFISGVSFIAGYVSYGLSTGNWGKDALISGGIAACSAWLAYNLGPAGLDYGRYLANTALRVASSQIPPIQFGNMSFSPGFMIGSDGLRVGIDMGIGMRIGDMNVSVGAGLYNNSNGFVSGLQGAELRRSIMFSYGNWAFGLNDFQSGETSQTNWMAGWSDGRWSIFTENDVFLSGDKYRTAALEIGYNNGHGTTYTAGFKLYTGPTTKKNKEETEWKNKDVYKYLAGIAYGGIRVRGQNIQGGYNSEGIRDFIQNNWHSLIGSPHIPINPNKQAGFYYNHLSYTPYTFY